MTTSKTVILALVAAGESIWTEEDRITGWVDLPLSESGLNQAREAAAILGTNVARFSAAFTSMMKRAIHTLNIILDELDINWIRYKKHWRLNPQNFGALQGLTKAEVIEKYGEEKYNLWMQSYETRPPQIDPNDEKHPSMEIKYVGVPFAALPCCESLQDCEKRVASYWTDKIGPALLAGNNTLVVSHRNTIRTLRKIIGNVEDISVTDLKVAQGIPQIYEFNDKLQVVDSYYLSDQEEVKHRIGNSSC